MVKHIWSILCKESVINQETNAISLLNVFEGFQVSVGKDAPNNQELVIPAEYEIVSLLRKESKVEETISLRVSLFNPENKMIAEPVITQLTIPKDRNNHRHRVKSFGFKITKQGTYKFIVEIKQRDSKEFSMVSELPVDVSIHKT